MVLPLTSTELAGLRGVLPLTDHELAALQRQPEPGPNASGRCECIECQFEALHEDFILSEDGDVGKSVRASSDSRNSAVATTANTGRRGRTKIRPLFRIGTDISLKQSDVPRRVGPKTPYPTATDTTSASAAFQIPQIMLNDRPLPASLSAPSPLTSGGVGETWLSERQAKKRVHWKKDPVARVFSDEDPDWLRLRYL